MKTYIVEKNKTTPTSGYYDVVVEGEENVLNRIVIRSRIQYFTTESGYDYNHPWEVAKQNAEAIAKGLNDLEELKKEQRRRIVRVV